MNTVASQAAPARGRRVRQLQRCTARRRSPLGPGVPGRPGGDRRPWARLRRAGHRALHHRPRRARGRARGRAPGRVLRPADGPDLHVRPEPRRAAARPLRARRGSPDRRRPRARSCTPPPAVRATSRRCRGCRPSATRSWSTRRSPTARPSCCAPEPDRDRGPPQHRRSRRGGGDRRRHRAPGALHAALGGLRLPGSVRSAAVARGPGDRHGGRRRARSRAPARRVPGVRVRATSSDSGRARSSAAGSSTRRRRSWCSGGRW